MYIFIVFFGKKLGFFEIDFYFDYDMKIIFVLLFCIILIIFFVWIILWFMREMCDGEI